MRRFSTVDLDKNIGDVKALAAREPVVITEHRKDRFVMMSIEGFQSATAWRRPSKSLRRWRDAERCSRSIHFRD